MSNYINPQSECRLLNVSITNDYKNQYTFGSVQEQTNFFLSKATSNHFTSLTFVRDGIITVEGQIYNLYNANYLMFKNKGFKDKWFYAFITEIEYVDEDTSLIHYELDVFQTWYFDIIYKQSFIVREHVTDDSIGANTLEENLGYGDYIFYDVNHVLQNLTDFIYVVAVSEPYPESPTDNYHVTGNLYDGIYSGLKYYAGSNINVLNQNLMQYCNMGKAEAIEFIFAVPRFCMPNFNDLSNGNVDRLQQVDPNSVGARALRSYTFNQSTIDGYTPKNNKLFCYPYNVIELTNNKGQTAEFKPELFSSFGTCNFEIMSNMCGNVSVACFPSNYEKLQTDTDEGYFSADTGITLNNFPQCAWTSDFYKNWLAQNSYGNNIQLGLGLGTGIANLGTGIATGNPIATTIGVSTIAQTIGNRLSQERKAQVTPNQAHGNSSNIDVLIAHGLLGFYINHKTIKREFAKIIDDYFSMYGYKVNKLGIPALRSRINWNYIETDNINITGDIPQDHLVKIKNMFDKGVTLWHNDNIGNYSRTNPNR